MTSFDIERARAETPGCRNVIHFNHAGASLMPRPVLDAVIGHLRREAEIGGYEALLEARDREENVYDGIASMLGCDRDEVALIENATRAWDMAFYSIRFKQGDRILCSMAEYASNYIAFLQVADRTGARIDVIPNDEFGQVSIDSMQKMIDGDVKLISITHVPTNSGLVNPAAAVGAVAKKAGIPFLLDACQSAGQMPLRVDELGCDMLSATGRKFLRGPRGTGFLYVRRSWIDHLQPVMLDLHAATWTSRDRYEIRNDARRFENWESNFAGKIGLGVAIQYALQWGLDRIQVRIRSLAGLLREGLQSLKNITIRDPGTERCGIVSFTVEGRDSSEIAVLLRQRHINVWRSPLQYTRLDMEERGISHVVRASVHYYNTEEEIARFLSVLKQLL